ncbi:MULTISPECIES: VOC family protein [Neobacillus]|uniref:VOC family protein n=1 Tax=Neobacillus rhizophilus TaxID=2833579 RepID=A0A942YV65_9BACI|nr:MULTISPECIES: VOC family protein [Neobacillus]MBS4213824.1 VOC family protein [Neobacillus rhizophilus]MBU8917772.1 VOC family protein [Bacillus sp. FJAT-29953]
MPNYLWVNLPVKDMNRAVEFYKGLGFPVDTQPNSNQAKVIVGDNQVNVMLFQDSIFKNFTRSTITDTKQSAEVLFSIGAESREEVDDMAKKAVASGGTVFAEPGENQGWLYGCGIADPDGHRWNALYMDMSKMPKA